MVKVSQIISLGMDCIPRTILTRGGVKKNREQGALSCPLDLVLTSYESICEMIKEDFQDFTNRDYLKLESTGTITNTKYNVEFVHESENRRMILDFCRKNFQRLVERYDQRVKNFYHYIDQCVEQEAHIIFVVKHNEHPHELKAILQEKFPKLNFLLVALNIDFEGAKQMETIEIEKSIDQEGIAAYNFNFPGTDYIWHDQEHYNTEAGKTFEQGICNVFKEFLPSSALPV